MSRTDLPNQHDPASPSHPRSVGYAHADHAGPTVNIYYVIFGCLAVLTVITVAVSRVHLPPLAAVLLAFMIAISKASLVVAFFMHLKYDPKLLRLMCLVPTLLTMVLLLALLPDIASHGPQTAGPPVAAATEEAPTEEAHAAEH